MNETQYDAIVELIKEELESLKLNNYKPKGEIKDFPLEVIALMLVEMRLQAKNQGLEKNLYLFENNKQAGFIWKKSFDGIEFWQGVIDDEDFDLFFATYPKDVLTKEPPVGSIKMTVKEFTDSNKENLSKLMLRDKDVFDLTIELLASLKVLEKRN